MPRKTGRRKKEKAGLRRSKDDAVKGQLFHFDEAHTKQAGKRDMPEIKAFSQKDSAVLLDLGKTALVASLILCVEFVIYFFWR